VDVALIGPFDLTISLGEQSAAAPAVDEAIGRVVDAGRRHGVASGIHNHDPAVVLGWHARGMTMLTCNSDLGFFSAGAQGTVKALCDGIGAGGAGAQAGGGIHV
jgi:2-keto-3-deoxy-L-rhamnonate aldolase RhmA